MKKTILTICTLAITISAFAQTELNGIWTFKEQQSISGNLYSNGSPKAVKITGDKELTIEKTTAGQGSDIITKETVGTDKPYETITASKRKKTITFKKEGNKYTEYVTLYNATEPTKIDHKQTDTWYLENGELILDRKDENLTNGETWESKAIYAKVSQ